jgi:hypothetical protein
MRLIDGLLKLICMLVWVIMAAIIILGLVSHLSPSIFSFYIKIAKPLFWSFWGITLASLFFLIPRQEQHIKERLQKILTQSEEKMAAALSRLQIEERIEARLPGFLTLLLVVPTLLVVMESYLLIETLAYMWIIILVFTAVAVFRKIAKKDTIKDKVIKIHFGLITALGISISVLYLFWVSGIFHKPFVESTRFIDGCIFSELAREVGDNYHKIIEKEIQLDNIRSASYESYINKLENYSKQLKKGKLKTGTLPYEFQGNKTHNTVFIDRALDLIEGTTDKRKKQKVLDTLLNYLIRVTKKDYIDEINRQEKKHKINIILLGKLNDLINYQNLETEKWRCLLCCIKEYTKISVSGFGIQLGKKECEPCLRD